MARVLQEAGFATLLMDLLSVEEEAFDAQTAALRFDIELLARRLGEVTWWLVGQKQTAKLPIGLFGASTGAAAALVSAAEIPALISTIVARAARQRAIIIIFSPHCFPSRGNRASGTRRSPAEPEAIQAEKSMLEGRS